MSQSSPTPDPVAWMVRDANGLPTFAAIERSTVERLVGSLNLYPPTVVRTAPFSIVPLGELVAHPALPATTPSDDATLIADHMLRFWTPVPESYGVMQAAKRILVAAGQEIPEGLINRYLRLSAPSEGSAPDTPTENEAEFAATWARIQDVPPSAPDTKPDERIASGDE